MQTENTMKKVRDDAEMQPIGKIVASSFLSRVPEIMARGGFTLQAAVEQAYREDEALCLELCDGGRTERARRALHVMADHAYARLRRETGK